MKRLARKNANNNNVHITKKITDKIILTIPNISSENVKQFYKCLNICLFIWINDKVNYN